MAQPLEFRLGVKTDPIEYRYSFPWLFNLLAEEGVKWVQIGTHFEHYQLPDEFFHELREEADKAGVVIDSMFTAHRELGGFFRTEPGYEQVARKNFERYIETGAILGVRSVGSNPGAVLRDQMKTKEAGTACYIRHMKELMHFAHDKGVPWLTIEPMSCLAEPPTLPSEIAGMGQELREYHAANASNTSRTGYCTDIAHGYADRDGKIVNDHFELFKATIPDLYEIHLKNTDSQYNSTFGFTQAERERGIIEVAAFRKLLQEHADQLPVDIMTGYLEIGGPKLGRDYSDHHVEASLRESLQYLKTAYLEDAPETGSPTPAAASLAAANGKTDETHVEIAPSMMCVDPLNFEDALRKVEETGVDMLHMDIMDGHFVPNMPMGLAVLEALKSKTELPLDVHLMVQDNDFFVGLLKETAPARISVHLETCPHLDRTLAMIRENGSQAGVAINPSTPLEAIEFVLERIDYVLLMTVNPGYAGQKMTPASIRKIKACRKMLDDAGYGNVPIQVDGNVSFENIPAMVAAGAVNLVAGTSSIFRKGAAWAANKQTMLKAIQEGLAATV